MVAVASRTILDNLDLIPNANNRTKIAFIAVDTAVHFFSIPVRLYPSLLCHDDTI
jgi:protein transport protein SEC24